MDLASATIRVCRNAPEVNGQKLMDQPLKTAGSERSVFIPAALVAMLREHLGTFGNRFDATSLVFTNGRGAPVSQSNFRKNVFQPAARRARISPVPRVHDLRHTSASFMAEQGFTMTEAGAQLGHMTEAMTERYTESFEETRRAKVALLSGILPG